MSRGVLTTATIAATVAFFVAALVLGISQPQGLVVAEAPVDATPVPSEGNGDAEPTTGADDPAPEVTAPPVEDAPPAPAETPEEELLGRLSVITSFGGIPSEGGDIVFDISITNAGETTVTFDDSHISLEDPTGPLEVVASGDPAFGPTELAPRDSASGSIVFRVPPDSEGLRLIVAPPDVVRVEIRL